MSRFVTFLRQVRTQRVERNRACITDSSEEAMKKTAKTNTKPTTKATVTVNDLPTGVDKEKSVKGGALNLSFNVAN
jgi:hypothetical protein